MPAGPHLRQSRDYPGYRAPPLSGGGYYPALPSQTALPAFRRTAAQAALHWVTCADSDEVSTKSSRNSALLPTNAAATDLKKRPRKLPWAFIIADFSYSVRPLIERDVP